MTKKERVKELAELIRQQREELESEEAAQERARHIAGLDRPKWFTPHGKDQEANEGAWLRWKEYCNEYSDGNWD